MRYTIKNEKVSVTLESVGAEIISVVMDGKERVWQNETGEWAGHGPMLFPVCGHCGVTVNGVSYPISAHGFSRKIDFTLENSGTDFVTLTLKANEETKKQYPFDFVFRVTYALKENTLSVIYDVENPASTPLYFACGGHESYALDYDLDAYELVFEKEEKLVHCEHNEAGYLIDEYCDFGTHTVYPLPLERLTKSATVIFKNVASRKVRLQEKNGKPLCELTFEGFENLLLWRAMRAKYICIEPWTNLPDIADKPDVEFSQKAGVIKVEPKDTKKLVRTITYL